MLYCSYFAVESASVASIVVIQASSIQHEMCSYDSHLQRSSQFTVHDCVTDIDRTKMRHHHQYDIVWVLCTPLWESLVYNNNNSYQVWKSSSHIWKFKTCIVYRIWLRWSIWLGSSIPIINSMTTICYRGVDMHASKHWLTTEYLPCM